MDNLAIRREEDRYTSLEDFGPAKLEALEDKVKKSKYRCLFHIQPKTGLLNDPNGLAYFKGRYHLFYQWFPLGPIHGLKHWYHLSSKDLLNWKDEGLFLKPEKDYESHGIFSGSGLVEEDRLYLFYTANRRDDDWKRISSQSMALMNDKGQAEKLDQPLFVFDHPGYTSEIRDPKVWKEDGFYHMILGGQNKEERGRALLFKSKNLYDWDFQGDLRTRLDDFGFMWECPDLFSLKDKRVLIFSPQGLDRRGYDRLNIYSSGYLVADKKDLSEDFNHGDYRELDQGFDFYAPQTFNDGKDQILFAWMGLPEISYPSDEDGWAHILSLPRRLDLRKDRLYQEPHPNLLDLRKNEKIFEMGQEKIEIGNYCELELVFNKKTSHSFSLATRDEGSLDFTYDQGLFSLDRSGFGRDFGGDFGYERYAFLPEIETMRIFIDRSSIEIFINGGESVLSSRYFTDDKNLFLINQTSDRIKVKRWDLV